MPSAGSSTRSATARWSTRRRAGRVMVTESSVGATSEPTLRDLSEALIAVYGTDYGIHSPTWISRFTDMTRQAAAYRDGTGPAGRRRRARAFPGRWTGPQHRRAGCGEPGMEAGPGGQRDIAGKPPGHLPRRAPPGRRPRAAHHDGAGRASARPTIAPRRCATPWPSCSSMDEPRKRFAAMMSGLDIHYDLGEGHPLLGRRMPDLDLVTADGPLRVFTLLHEARPVLLNLGEPGGFDITPWADRVRSVDADTPARGSFRRLGAVAAPAAVLIRPDGYVAWVGDQPSWGSLTLSPRGSDRPLRRRTSPSDQPDVDEPRSNTSLLLVRVVFVPELRGALTCPCSVLQCEGEGARRTSGTDHARLGKWAPLPRADDRSSAGRRGPVGGHLSRRRSASRRDADASRAQRQQDRAVKPLRGW